MCCACVQEELGDRLVAFLAKPDAAHVVRVCCVAGGAACATVSHTHTHTPRRPQKDTGEPKKTSSGAAAGGAAGRKRKAASEDKPARAPRGPSSFMIFSKEKRPEVVAANPGMATTDVARKLGEMWRGLSEAQKQSYKEKAAALAPPKPAAAPKKPAAKKAGGRGKKVAEDEEAEAAASAEEAGGDEEDEE